MAKKKPLIEEARAYVQLVIDSDGNNRSAAQDDLKFAAGDQWDAQVRMQRVLQRRPCLTINKTDTFVRSVVNNMRQQRPRIKVHPVSDGADKAIADVIQGLIRHIEVQSNADNAYDTGADYQVRMGWGYWDIVSKYCDDMSWEQDLALEKVRNPFSVYFDPSSTQQAGLDAERCAITHKIRKETFEAKYPGKAAVSWSLIGPGDDQPTKDEVMLLEYRRFESTPMDLVRLSDGRSMWADEFNKAKEGGTLGDGIIEIDRRKSFKSQLKQSLLSGKEELESRELPGKYVRMIRVLGAELCNNGEVIRYGMVRQLKDPAKGFNFFRTAQIELASMTIKAGYIMAEGQDEGHEDEWDQAHIKNYSRLQYKPITGPDGQTVLPPPMAIEPRPIPEAIVSAAMMASDDLKAVAGMFDPALGAQGNETSGEMVEKRQKQSDLSNFHFYDNLTVAISGTGTILLDLIPHYYDTKRVVRIIGEDGTPESVTLNEQAVGKVLNDVTVGKYDVVMDTGPGYDTKRMEAVEYMMGLAKAFPMLAQVGGDLILRQIDAPGMDALADRLAAIIPAAQIDKQLPKDMDPQVKKFVGALMMQLQQAKQVVQQLTMEKEAKIVGMREKEELISQREGAKQAAETERAHLKEGAATHREIIKLDAQEQMNTQDNKVSMYETELTVAANLELGHQKAQQHGVPNNNRPTNQK